MIVLVIVVGDVASVESRWVAQGLDIHLCQHKTSIAAACFNGVDLVKTILLTKIVQSLTLQLTINS